MSVPDRSIDPKLLAAAKKEFLDKGFEMASLADICNEAGVTTGALYKRYKGKEDLFAAVVADTVREMEEARDARTAPDLAKLTDRELYDAWTMTPEANRWWFRFLYDRREEFTLLVKCSAGTRYGNFPHDWAERMNEIDYAYYLEARRRGLAKNEISLKEMHVLTSAYWSMYYEPFIHGFTWERIEEHIRLICLFVDWHKALDFRQPEQN